MSGAAQRPAKGALVLDHIAHWVPDRTAAEAELRRLGFAPTPFSEQFTRGASDAGPVSAGTGNHCAMLERGYLEFLAPIGDTPNASSLRAGMARYTGVHLIALGTADPDAEHTRLAREGFGPLPVVALERDIGTPDGVGRARFAVVRTQAGAMPEGRVQFVEQRTPDLLWQARWLDHPNTAYALRATHLCVADPAEAAARFARYTGLPVATVDAAPGIVTARGTMIFRNAARTKADLGLEAPCLPWIAGCTLACRDPARVPAGRETAHGRVVVPSAALGGAFVFESGA
ncbi:MAG: VOC family protein [Azospirillum sp.]|nr:VOC family protein [Azospirillum sp.]